MRASDDWLGRRTDRSVTIANVGMLGRTKECLITIKFIKMLSLFLF